MYPVYSMLYTVNLGLCDYVLFSQIRSHISAIHFCFISFKCFHAVFFDPYSNFKFYFFMTDEPFHTASITRHTYLNLREVLQSIQWFLTRIGKLSLVLKQSCQLKDRYTRRTEVSPWVIRTSHTYLVCAMVYPKAAAEAVFNSDQIKPIRHTHY